MPRAAAAAPGTGLTQEEERLISNLTLLVFTPTPSGDPLCERVIENLVPTPVPNTENAQYTLTATLPTGYYRLMFLANVAGKITADPPLGKTLSTIESTLLHTMQTPWDIATHTTTGGFPMTGATPGYIQVNGNYTHTEPIVMLRMHARINVTVADPVKDNIKISTIRLHNPSSRGLVLPAETNLDTAATGYIRAIAPSLPLVNGVPDPGLLATPWEYTGTAIDNGNECLNTIYTMEGYDPQGREDDEYAWLELTCSYNDEPEEDYRIDFQLTREDGTRQPIGLLRNHSYEIVILSMTGEAGLEFEVMEWNDSDMSDIIIEGRYFLKVNQSNFELDREPKDANSFSNKLTIQTNYEEGWVIDRITGPGDGAPINMDNGWIQIAPGDRTGPQQQEKTISILLEENTTGAPVVQRYT